MDICYGDMCKILIFGFILFFFQAEDGIRDLVRSRGLGDVYKRQDPFSPVSITKDAMQIEVKDYYKSWLEEPAFA